MADVNVVIDLYAEDDFIPPKIITLTVNSVEKSVSSTSFGYTTGTLVYAEGTPLTIIVTSSPGYYENENWSTNAAEGTITKYLSLVNPTVTSTWILDVRSQAPCYWTVDVLPTSLGRPIILVDYVPILLIGKIDDSPSGNIRMIDGVFIGDGTWHVDVRSTDVGIDWKVTVTS